MPFLGFSVKSRSLRVHHFKPLEINGVRHGLAWGWQGGCGHAGLGRKERSPPTLSYAQGGDGGTQLGTQTLPTRGCPHVEQL